MRESSKLVLAIVVIGLALLGRQFLLHSDSSIAFYLLLCMPFDVFRETTLQHWKTNIRKNLDRRVLHPSAPIPEISASAFTYDVMKKATFNFRYPAVVRGLFNNTKAQKLWPTLDYLPGILSFQIPVVKDARVGTLQNERELVSFAEAFRKMLKRPSSKEYLFFPVKSRFTFKGSKEGNAAELQDKVNKLVAEDLDLDRISLGFGVPEKHKAFVGSQMIIGKSKSGITNESTGSDFHCAAGNNWFIMVVGQKQWEFVDPEYSSFMSPLKGGLFNMWNGNGVDMKDIFPYIPSRKVTLYPGDLLYNPDWQWHKITNIGGFSIGVPIREMKFPVTFRNNKLFTLVVFVSLLASKFGIELGGFAPPSAATEADN